MPPRRLPESFNMTGASRWRRPVRRFAATMAAVGAAAALMAASCEPTPGPPPPPPPADDGVGILCPVQGPMRYTDTYGAPRSGGRTHQGVDLISDTGTPLVAAVAGRVRYTQNSLGGNAVYLTGSDGHTYYYAHLSRFAGSDRTVSRGELVGYVGSTGNAGIPHLHFEVRPNGGAAVNPYPYVREAGC
ncbi:MAG: M23 family metallopeptidase [Ilumatobacteraceae bacterium]